MRTLPNQVITVDDLELKNPEEFFLLNCPFCGSFAEMRSWRVSRGGGYTAPVANIRCCSEMCSVRPTIGLIIESNVDKTLTQAFCVIAEDWNARDGKI